VSGAWSGGYAGSFAGTTDTNGMVSLTTGLISKKSSSVTFTISSVARSGLSYESAANHDPDGDSNGTNITVTKP